MCALRGSIPVPAAAVNVTYIHHRITNAASESLNSKIQWVKYTPRGFRNKNNFVTAILFPLRRPQPPPHTH